MDEATIKNMAAELAKGLKTPEDCKRPLNPTFSNSLIPRQCPLKFKWTPIYGFKDSYRQCTNAKKAPSNLHS